MSVVSDQKLNDGRAWATVILTAAGPLLLVMYLEGSCEWMKEE